MYTKLKTIIYTFNIFIIAFYGGIFIGGKIVQIKNNFLNANVYNTTINNQTKEETIPAPETTIYFVGDIMLTRGVKNSVMKNFNGDYGQLFINLPKLKKADILFGNLEGDISDIGNNVGSKYSFRMDPAVLPALKEAGFNIVLFANNHVGDWNVTAFKDTLTRLSNIGIEKTGAGMDKSEAENPTIIEKNGIKFGFLGFSDVGPGWISAKENTPGILIASDPRLGEIIGNAKAKCDVLIVSFHWGIEYKTVHNQRQEDLAHLAIDSGADMIIGGHPHVIQDIGTYKDKPIVYSLGNFIFDQYFSKDTMRGMIFQTTFDGKDIKSTKNQIITLNKNYQPEGIFTKEFLREKDELLSSVCPKPKREYLDMSLLNIGQEVGLPDTTYIPSDLRELNTQSSTKTGICLRKEARDAFELLVTEARKNDYKIKASSGFRSYNYQQNLINTREKEGVDTSKSIAKAGYSEHQLGVTIDLTGSPIGYAGTTIKFESSVESKWLEENAYKYGFVMSYPKDKEYVTGYIYEPWHYRYVGIDMAQKIKDNGLTITEFLRISEE